jgi:hypothetical protein
MNNGIDDKSYQTVFKPVISKVLDPCNPCDNSASQPL